jgi:hypothetical protein
VKLIVLEGGSVDFRGKLYLTGETLDVPGKEAKRLLDKGVCELCDDGEIARTPALSEMTVTSLKELLDRLEVSYDAKTKKDDLIALVEANTGKIG